MDLEIRRPGSLELPRRPVADSTRLIHEHERGKVDTAWAHREHTLQQGRELAGVKAGETYGQQRYTNFNEYCDKDLPFAHTTARKIMLFYKVVKAAREEDLPEPTSMTNMEALISVTPGYSDEQRVQVWCDMARDSGPEITTKDIRQLVVGGVQDGNDSDNGRGVEEISRQREQDALQEMRDELDTRERAVAKLEEDREKLEQQEQKMAEERDRVDAMQEELNKRTTVMQQQFKEETAKRVVELRAKYGEVDESKPTFLTDITGEAWKQALSEAKSFRVMEVGRQLSYVASMATWMKDYFPDEGTEAVADMPFADELTEALEYVIDWLQRTVNGVQAKQ
jgi:hypothetical protein